MRVEQIKTEGAKRKRDARTVDLLRVAGDRTVFARVERGARGSNWGRGGARASGKRTVGPDWGLGSVWQVASRWGGRLREGLTRGGGCCGKEERGVRWRELSGGGLGRGEVATKDRLG